VFDELLRDRWPQIRYQYGMSIPDSAENSDEEEDKETCGMRLSGLSNSLSIPIGITHVCLFDTIRYALADAIHNVDIVSIRFVVSESHEFPTRVFR
jgi:hypothetical protein